MSPILVPTLAELGIELERAWAAETAALRACDQNTGKDEPCVFEHQAAVAATSDLVDQIAAMPAASLADLRVKAKALSWYHITVEGPEFGRYTDERLAQELVAGLLGGLV